MEKLETGYRQLFSFTKRPIQYFSRQRYSIQNLGKGSKTPITAFCCDGGTPSPHHGQKINGKKITAKGGTPPPPSRQAAWNFFAKNGVFCLKNNVFGPIFNRFFNHGKGGYPPPPHHGKRPAKKLTGKKSRQRGVPPPHHGTRPAKKLTEKKSRQGGVPPPITAQSRDWGF